MIKELLKLGFVKDESSVMPLYTWGIAKDGEPIMEYLVLSHLSNINYIVDDACYLYGMRLASIPDAATLANVMECRL
jgi:hypothetical protein